jgi:hypothetical protein
LAHQLGSFKLEQKPSEVEESTADMTEEMKEVDMNKTEEKKVAPKKKIAAVKTNGPASNLRSRIKSYQN